MFGILKNQHFKKLIPSAALLLSITLLGTLGYKLIENSTWFDALYMTVITVATIGYGEIIPLSHEGRMFTIFLITLSFGTFAFAITSISNYVLSGEFNKYLKNKRLNTAIQQLKGHTIVCGFGRNGRQAALQLKNQNQSFVVIEKNADLLIQLQELGYLYVEGDATNDDIFFKANVDNAKALITTLPVDADNLFIVLTARSANKNLVIISRASDDSSDKKLKAAGANNVIMPDKIGGAHMASLVVKPDVIEFIDYLTGQIGVSNNLVELTFDNLPEQLQNKSIKDLEIRNKTGANIVGFKTGSGEFIINPSPDTKMIPSAKIFVLGTEDQIKKMKEIFA